MYLVRLSKKTRNPVVSLRLKLIEEWDNGVLETKTPLRFGCGVHTTGKDYDKSLFCHWKYTSDHSAFADWQRKSLLNFAAAQFHRAVDFVRSAQPGVLNTNNTFSQVFVCYPDCPWHLCSSFWLNAGWLSLYERWIHFKFDTVQRENYFLKQLLAEINIQPPQNQPQPRMLWPAVHANESDGRALGKRKLLRLWCDRKLFGVCNQLKSQ